MSQKKSLLATFKQWLAAFKQQVLVLYFITRHPLTSAWVRWLAVLTVAYLLSPIDLVPDFIPVLGVLDDLLLVPLFIALVLRLTPLSVRQQCEQEAAAAAHLRLPRSQRAAVVIGLLWAGMLVAALYWFSGWYQAGQR